MADHRILRIVSSSSNQAGFDAALARLDLNILTYDEILEELKGLFLLYPSSFKAEMEKLGWEVLEVIPNSLILQKKWVESQDLIMAPRPSWMEEALLKQIETFKPQILYFERGCSFSIFSDVFRRSLKQRFPFLKLAVGFWGNTGVDCKRFADIDWMFVMDAVFHRAFQAQGIPSQICYHSFEHRILSKLDNFPVKKEDFVFAGVSGYGLPDHRERYFDLRELMDRTSLKVWCLEYPHTHFRTKLRAKLVRSCGVFPSPWLNACVAWTDRGLKNSSTLARILRDALRLKRGEYFDDWYFGAQPLQKLYPNRVFSPLFGLEYFQLMLQSKVILNRHVDMKGHYGNMRTFEVCGVGGCLLTDRGQEMKHLYEIDSEMVAFNSAEECLEKVSYLLQNDKAREKIGQKAKARTLKSHLFAHRAPEISDRLKTLLRAKTA